MSNLYCSCSLPDQVIIHIYFEEIPVCHSCKKEILPQPVPEPELAVTSAGDGWGVLVVNGTSSTSSFTSYSGYWVVCS